MSDFNIPDASEHSALSLHMSNIYGAETHCTVAHRDASTQTSLPDKPHWRPDEAHWRLFAATLLLRSDNIQIRNLLQERFQGELSKQFDMDIYDIGVHSEDDDMPTALIQLAGKCDMKKIIDENEGFNKFFAKALSRNCRNLFVCRCMSYNITAIAQKGEFLNLVDHIALQDHFGGPRKKRRGKKESEQRRSHEES